MNINIPKSKAEFAAMLVREYGHDERLAEDCASIVAGFGAFNPILHDPEAMAALETLIERGYSSAEICAAMEAAESTPQAVDGEMTLDKALRQKLISVRSVNNLCQYKTKKPHEITLVYVKALLAEPGAEVALLRAPNFGRKSLNEIKSLVARVA